MNYTHIPQRRPSWRGVLAGLLIGLVVVMAMIALALVLASFLPFSLQGSSIAAGIYAAITALVSSYAAGYFAVKYSAPENLFGDGTEIDEKDATLTGLLTGAAILTLSTLLTLSSATSILSTATNAATSAVGTATSAVTTVAGTAASAAGTATSVGTTAAGAAAADTDFNLQQEVQSLYNRVTGDISRGDIEGWVAKNTQGLNRDQINASVDVIQNMVNANKNQISQLDFTSMDTWRNLDTIATNRMSDIEQTLTGDEIIRRLQNQGLTEGEAREVRKEVVSTYEGYRNDIEQRVVAAKQRVDEAAQKAEDYARKAALYSGLFWLISALLTLLASILGSRNAAANYKLDKPIIRMGDNVR